MPGTARIASRLFGCVAAMIVPASAKYAVPRGDDDLIFADILKSLGRDTNDVRTALAIASRLAGGPIGDLGTPARDALAVKLRTEGGNPLAVFTRVVLLCYYRDDRVMLSLGLVLRPPFPKGYVLEQGRLVPSRLGQGPQALLAPRSLRPWPVAFAHPFATTGMPRQRRWTRCGCPRGDAGEWPRRPCHAGEPTFLRRPAAFLCRIAH
jgi:hypothetical protein